MIKISFQNVKQVKITDLNNGDRFVIIETVDGDTVIELCGITEESRIPIRRVRK